MAFEETVWHFVAVAALLLIGLPTNTAVIWIHTRKNSRVAKNKFPLIFAVIDLIALLVTLPLQLSIIIGDHTPPYMNCVVCEIRTGVGIYVVNSYLSTLLMATIDKFVAVMYPFKYDSCHKRFLNVALIFAFGVNVVSTSAVAMERFNESRALSWTVMAYNIALALMFLTVIGLFVAIGVRLIQNERKLRKIGPVTHR